MPHNVNAIEMIVFTLAPSFASKQYDFTQKREVGKKLKSPPSPPSALIWNHVSLDLRSSLGINVADTFIQLLSLI